MKQLDAIIFDVDGTLWDSTAEVANAWNASIEKHLNGKGFLDKEGIMALFGKTMDEIWALVFPEMDEKKRKSFSNICSDEEVEWLKTHPGEIYKGVYQTMEELSERLPLYIVSNCQCGYIEVMLETTKMEKFFQGQLCFGDTNMSKDRTILKLLEQHNLKNVVYVGDTQGDADSCKKAGVPFVFAKYGFGDVPDAADVLADIRELPAWLEK
ncbi:MAG: HAD family hydrolase [Hespellia sp.]|nr:HAD family hydrolase [Hespellia sp.]